MDDSYKIMHCLDVKMITFSKGAMPVTGIINLKYNSIKELQIAVDEIFKNPTKNISDFLSNTCYISKLYTEVTINNKTTEFNLSLDNNCKVIKSNELKSFINENYKNNQPKELKMEKEEVIDNSIVKIKNNSFKKYYEYNDVTYTIYVSLFSRERSPNGNSKYEVTLNFTNLPHENIERICNDELLIKTIEDLRLIAQENIDGINKKILTKFEEELIEMGFEVIK